MLPAVTGDTHASWLLENNLNTVLEGTKLANTTLGANLIDTNYKRGQLVEFGGTAVSSSGWGNTWLNEKNATSRAATGLVQNSGSLFWSEGFCESPTSQERCVALTLALLSDRGYMAVEVSYSAINTTFYGYPDNQIKRTKNRMTLAQFTVPAGQNQVQRYGSSPRNDLDAGAVKPGN
jgi:alkaline phosphatase D